MYATIIFFTNCLVTKLALSLTWNNSIKPIIGQLDTTKNLIVTIIILTKITHKNQPIERRYLHKLLATYAFESWILQQHRQFSVAVGCGKGTDVGEGRDGNIDCILKLN